MTGWAHKHQPWRKALRSFRHAAEALLQALLMGFFWLLPVDWASGLGGWLTRQIGTRLSTSRRAMKHLAIAFPEMPEAERRVVVASMWDNLGRMIAEYPHLGTIADPASGRVEVLHAERMVGVQQGGKPFIGFSAHMANFELMPIVAYNHGLNLTVVSRPVNNPFIQRILLYFRERPTGNWGKVPKGIEGGRQTVKLLDQGLNLGVLVDQRTSQGVALPLFGHPARTTLGIAKLAIDKDLPIVPVHLERLGGARFRITLEEPVAVPRLGDRQEEAKAMMTEVNRIIERWVRQRPGDWLWLHRRWDRP
ncbi:lauroyl acyltransferase [Pelagibius sp. 7325]|uniref:LpxL/LpxP family acyltransferase n=1 Tax=Pelagibius sp. 7325 TaxID=3131994 RepID=UPI0030EF3F09